MAIKIEQIDIANVSKIFAIKSDLKPITDTLTAAAFSPLNGAFSTVGLRINDIENRFALAMTRQHILSLLANLTAEEVKALGINAAPPVIPDPNVSALSLTQIPYDSRLQFECTTANVVSISLNLIQNDVNVLSKILIPDANGIVIFTTDPMLVGDYDYQVIAFGENNVQGAPITGTVTVNVVKPRPVGVLLNGKWYGPDAPEDVTTQWVRGDFVNDRYWVSMTDVPVGLVNSTNVQYIGVRGVKYNNLILSREQNLPDDLGLTQEHAIVYGGMLYGMNDYITKTEGQSTPSISEKLGMALSWVHGEFYQQSSTPNDAVWFGPSPSQNIGLPENMAVWDTVFHINAVVDYTFS